MLMILYCADESAGPVKRDIAGQLEIREQEWGTYVLYQIDIAVRWPDLYSPKWIEGVSVLGSRTDYA